MELKKKVFFQVSFSKYHFQVSFPSIIPNSHFPGSGSGSSRCLSRTSCCLARCGCRGGCRGGCRDCLASLQRGTHLLAHRGRGIQRAPVHSSTVSDPVPKSPGHGTLREHQEGDRLCRARHPPLNGSHPVGRRRLCRHGPAMGSPQDDEGSRL